MTNAESDAIIEALKAELKESRYHTDKLQARLRSVITPLTRDTYGEAVRIYGKHSQLIMSMEEMAELSKELSKNIRGEHNAEALAEEMADVEIMLEQLKIIFGNRAAVDIQKSMKLQRLANRLAADSGLGDG